MFLVAFGSITYTSEKMQKEFHTLTWPAPVLTQIEASKMNELEMLQQLELELQRLAMLEKLQRSENKPEPSIPHLPPGTLFNGGF